MIGAIIVLYNPDFKLLFKGLDALLPQVDEACIIDNSSVDNNYMFLGYNKINYIPLNKNVGIATAQNIGIKHFICKKFDYIIFSDQDSVASEGLISELLFVFESLANNNIKVAALGPMPINRVTAKPYITSTNIKEIFSKGKICDNYSLYEMYSIISSFSIIKLDSFELVGTLEDNLFIDGVDDEWGWRAFYKGGLRSFIVYELTFSHFQGSDNNVIYKKSTPFRSYFQFRNFIVLLKRSYVPFYWKRRNLIKFMIKLFYYPLFVSPRLNYLKEILKGIKDGITNKLGER